MSRVIARPATLVLYGSEGQEVIVAREARLVPGDRELGESPMVLSWPDGITDRRFNVAPHVDVPGMVVSSIGDSSTIMARATIEGDASDAGIAGCPLPVDLIQAIIGGVMNVTLNIDAAVDDDGYVDTLLLASDVGFWMRADGAWHRVADTSAVDDHRLIDVPDQSVNVFDAADMVGARVHVTELTPVSELTQPGLTDVSSPAEAEPEVDEPAPILSAGDIRQIETADELLAAAKTCGDDMKWYILKRARALGVDEESIEWS